MVKVFLILSIFLPQGGIHISESVWYSFEDCQRAGESLTMFFARESYAFTCNYLPPKP